jgi:hypothetical protein
MKSADVKNWLRRNCFAPGNSYPFLFLGHFNMVSSIKRVGSGVVHRLNAGFVQFFNAIKFLNFLF